MDDEFVGETQAKRVDTKIKTVSTFYGKPPKEFIVVTHKNSAFDIACQIIFFSDVAIAIKKREKVTYYDNMYRDAVSNQKKYIEKIM